MFNVLVRKVTASEGVSHKFSRRQLRRGRDAVINHGKILWAIIIFRYVSRGRGKKNNDFQVLGLVALHAQSGCFSCVSEYLILSLCLLWRPLAVVFLLPSIALLRSSSSIRAAKWKLFIIGVRPTQSTLVETWSVDLCMEGGIILASWG